MGFGFGGAQMIPWMNFPDTLDVAELKLGERPTGNYSGMMTLIRKIGGALGVGMIGWVMTGVGYDQYNAAITGAKAYTDKFAADYSAEFTADFNSQTSQTIGSFLNDNSNAITDKVNQLVTNGKISEVGELNMAEISANVDKVLLTIRLLMGIAIALLIAIAMFGSFKFKLNNKILARMRYFTDKVKAGEYDTLTEEEKQERIDLIKKHYGKYDARFDAEMIARMKENALLCKAEEDAKNQNLDTEKA